MIPGSWTPSCRHIHVNGRPCDGSVRVGYRYCDPHSAAGGAAAGVGLCDACRSMLTSFAPAHGWNQDARRQLRRR